MPVIYRGIAFINGKKTSCICKKHTLKYLTPGIITWIKNKVIKVQQIPMINTIEARI